MAEKFNRLRCHKEKLAVSQENALRKMCELARLPKFIADCEKRLSGYKKRLGELPALILETEKEIRRIVRIIEQTIERDKLGKKITQQEKQIKKTTKKFEEM